MKVVYSADHRLHDPTLEFETSTHHAPWENPQRAELIRDALLADGTFSVAAPTHWGTAPIEAVHDPGLVRFLRTAWSEYQQVNGPTTDVVPDVFVRGPLRDKMSPAPEPASIDGRLGYWCFETTTPLTATTFDAALASIDTALTTAQLVLDGERQAYGLCRPPGHHAATAMYGGYCFFNNAAVVAHHLATTTGSRVTVLDVDYHHGNGTQQIFYDRDDVQYVSVHADPHWAYPYSVGFADETGSGRGTGCNLNLPLARRTDDDGYLTALDQGLAAIDAFGPAMVVVSLGVDTFVDDPICDFAVTTAGFGRQGAAIRGLGVPTVVLQEGGYDLAAIGPNVVSFLRGLTD